MRFWDTSAIVPLLIQEPSTPTLLALLTEDPEAVIWWGTRVEYRSAISRSFFEGRIQVTDRDAVVAAILGLEEAVLEIPPLEATRNIATQLVAEYPHLRAADALQLAAARLWCLGDVGGKAFVCLDQRLRQAAEREGFEVLPKDISFP